MNIDDEVLKEKLANAKILIVEDQPLNIIILQNILSPHYQVCAVHSGEEALEQCKTYTPDLIILDIKLPGIDGVETCKRLKNLPAVKNVPVLFITSFHQHEEYCWQAGGVDFIPKPIAENTVFNRVKAHLTIKLQRDKLLEMVFLDSLSQIYNRRYFDSHVKKIDLHAKREKEDYTLILLDIDFFKQFNDIYGHITADEALKKVAKTISETLKRPSDFVARFGGEEFIVVLPGTNIKGGISVAENILKNINALNIPHDFSPLKHLTVSAGLATLENSQGQASVLQVADDKLYKAKQSGRNKLSF